MSIRDRYVRGHLSGGGPFTRLPECHTAVEMDAPALSVVERTESVNSGPERRSVGLALMFNGVRVDVRNISDVDELIRDLESARIWVREG